MPSAGGGTTIMYEQNNLAQRNKTLIKESAQENLFEVTHTVNAEKTIYGKVV